MSFERGLLVPRIEPYEEEIARVDRARIPDARQASPGMRVQVRRNVTSRRPLAKAPGLRFAGGRRLGTAPGLLTKGLSGGRAVVVDD